jgi:hypothetical protein
LTRRSYAAAKLTFRAEAIDNFIGFSLFVCVHKSGGFDLDWLLSLEALAAHGCEDWMVLSQRSSGTFTESVPRQKSKPEEICGNFRLRVISHAICGAFQTCM